jgi:hypothetical protein
MRKPLRPGAARRQEELSGIAPHDHVFFRYLVEEDRGIKDGLLMRYVKEAPEFMHIVSPRLDYPV